MNLVSWDPFETLSSLQSDIDRVFNRRLTGTRESGTEMANVDWLPAVDIAEDKESYHLSLDAPGMAKDQFEVTLEDTILTIKGEKKREVEKKEKNVYRAEREYGCFTRSFRLPETADGSRVNAEYKNGVLEINIAKKEAAKPRQIEVSVH